MMNLDDVCRKISKDLNLNFDIVRDIVMYQFRYTVNIMKDPEDTRDILFNKLFKFKLKSRFKENKNLKYNSK